MAWHCIRCHCHCLHLYHQRAASLVHRHCSVEASMAASSCRHLHLLQSQWITLPINYSSGLVSQILESRALLSRYYQRCGVFAYRTRVCYLIGRAIPGRDLFSVPIPVSEIAATENVAATVLQKSTCLEKFEGALSLLSSASGSEPTTQK